MSSSEQVANLRQLIDGVMDVEAVTLGGQRRETLSAHGRLRQPADEAFASLRPRFEDLGHTPFLRRKDGQDVITAVQEVFKPEASSPRRNIILFGVTIISVFVSSLILEVGLTFDLQIISIALPTSLLFTVSILGILGAHEMGHYLMAKRHGVQVTLPYFIPLPPYISFIGTLGAVILMKEPSPNRRVQFDIGVAGPLAGLVVAIPVLVIGLLVSEVISVPEFAGQLPPDAEVFPLEGNSLFYIGVKYAIFGKILPEIGHEVGVVRTLFNLVSGNVVLTPTSEDVSIHTVAFAGWVGLLITAINLLPVGQLDGGHVLFGLFGKRAQYAIWPFIALLLLMGFVFRGWWLLAALIYLLARGNAPVLDEITELDTGRRWLAIGMLVIFVLIFVPVPLKAVALPR